jgi:hypothetical protein
MSKKLRDATKNSTGIEKSRRLKMRESMGSF